MTTIQHIAAITGASITLYLGITGALPEWAGMGYLLCLAAPYFID